MLNAKKNTITKNIRVLHLLTAMLIAIPWSAAHGETEADRDPTDVLRKEHTIIRKMAGAAEQTAEDIRETNAVDTERVAKFHDFFKNFADRCHHAKEEDELFPVLKKMNVDNTTVDLLLKHHEEGRILLTGIQERLAALRNNGTEQDQEALAQYLDEYAQLMFRHIEIENEHLWPMASARLDKQQKDKLAKAFYRIEVEDLGEGFHQKYHAMAMEILGKSESP